MSKVQSEKASNNEEKQAPTSPRFGDSYELIGRETDDFLSKIEKEVVIVPLCTYSNEAKSASKYYLCTCSTSVCKILPQKTCSYLRSTWCKFMFMWFE